MYKALKQCLMLIFQFVTNDIISIFVLTICSCNSKFIYDIENQNNSYFCLQDLKVDNVPCKKISKSKKYFRLYILKIYCFPVSVAKL